MMTKTVNKYREFILKVGILSGTIIGAGVFSLPFIFKSAGLLAGFFYLAVSAAAFVVVYNMYADIIANSPVGEHRLLGFAGIYYGKLGSVLAAVSSIAQAVFVLTIYLILSVSFAELIFPGGAAFHKLVIFWALGSASIFLGLRKIAFLETLVTGGIVAIILGIFALGLPNIGKVFTNPVIFNLPLILLPLGPVLFSLSGRQAIPDVLKLGGNYKKAILVGTLLPAVVYALFIFGIMSLSVSVTPDAVGGLVGTAPAIFLIAVGLIGLLSLISSYITVGFDVYKSLEVDAKLSIWTRFLIVIFGPIVLYLSGFSNFIELISFVGGLLLAAETILIMAIWRRATGKRWGLGKIAVFILFTSALLYEIITL